jgi:hypothetical protein
VQVLEAASRAGDGSDDQEGRREIPQTLLRDSLKGLLAEIKETDHQSADNNDQATDQHNQSAASEADEAEDESQEIDEQEFEQAPLQGSTEPSTKLPTPTMTPTAESMITCSLAVDLLNLFFDKVQAWAPILHRPRFQAKYERQLLVDGDVMQGLPVDASLLFYSMFAMSARFSNHPRFAGVPPNKRGYEFARRARDFYSQARSLRNPSLTYLQGCILLANCKSLHPTDLCSLDRASTWLTPLPGLSLDSLIIQTVATNGLVLTSFRLLHLGPHPSGLDPHWRLCEASV